MRESGMFPADQPVPHAYSAEPQRRGPPTYAQMREKRELYAIFAL